MALQTAIDKVPGLDSPEQLSYLIGTGYGRNKVPFADENISEISCHAMGVHVTDPTVKAIIDIGGQGEEKYRAPPDIFFARGESALAFFAHL